MVLSIYAVLKLVTIYHILNYLYLKSCEVSCVEGYAWQRVTWRFIIMGPLRS